RQGPGDAPVRGRRQGRRHRGRQADQVRRVAQGRRRGPPEVGRLLQEGRSRGEEVAPTWTQRSHATPSHGALPMPATIERPSFLEGQILGPDDLNSLLQYPRDQEARHARYAHSWGIVYGLGAALVEGEIKVDAGLAIDSSGAARIVPDAQFLAVKDF